MQFQLTPAAMSRSGDSGAVELFYTVEDNVLNPCEAPANWPISRALGDGNVADGGGMADLTVFLVDANDRIVERQSLKALSDPTTQEITFRQLRLGTYTVYAYAHTEGNDWFAMPTESEISFANYKDAKLKLLDGTVPPTIANGRMPLTGKKEISVSFGDNSETIEMIRPVGKLSVSIINKRKKSINTTSFSLGKIFPSTGYVFPHNVVFPQNATSNPYYELPNLDRANITVLPDVVYNIYETLLYESQNTSAIQISMDYNTEDVTLTNFTGSLNGIDTGTKIIIKLVGTDLYLSVNPDTKKLIMVSASEFNEYCVWHLYGSGNQNRPIEHAVFDGYYINSENLEIIYAKKPNDLFITFQGDVEATTMDDIKYDVNTEQFSNNAGDRSDFQFFSVGESNIETGDINKEILEQIDATQTRPLTTIRRNQDVRLNLVFQ